MVQNDATHKKNGWQRRSVLAGLATLLGTRHVLGQTPRTLAEQWQENAPRWHRQSWDLKKTLSAPFKGITSDGNLVPNLFPVQATGVSTEAMRGAATKFLSSLTSEQRSRMMYEINDTHWRSWSNTHWYDLAGVSMVEMNSEQRDAFFALLKVSLSSRGYDLVRNAMRLNETLSEIVSERDYLGEWRYNVTMFGRPSSAEPWGWQFAGHHNVINYFVLGDQVVMTPQFIGGEPVIAKDGKYKGVTILQDEQNRGLAFINSLDQTLRGKAILSSSKTEELNVGESFKDNIVLAYAGIRATDLPAARQSDLLDLTELFIGNINAAHTRVRMDEIRSKLEETWFAWVGRTEPGSVFYYRIHSPVVLIEFDHQKPRTLSQFVPDSSRPIAEHIHCVVRTPNGNDYGKELLRQHRPAAGSSERLG